MLDCSGWNPQECCGSYSSRRVNLTLLFGDRIKTDQSTTQIAQAPCAPHGDESENEEDLFD